MRSEIISFRGKEILVNDYITTAHSYNEMKSEIDSVLNFEDLLLEKVEKGLIPKLRVLAKFGGMKADKDFIERMRLHGIKRSPFILKTFMTDVSGFKVMIYNEYIRQSGQDKYKFNRSAGSSEIEILSAMEWLVSGKDEIFQKNI